MRVFAGTRWDRVVEAAAPHGLAPQRMGRSPNFAFGRGDRTEGLYDVQTRKRPADVKAAYGPANLFRRNYTL
ncbi:hypothetical protein [Streptomyces sp. NPDC055400]